MPAVNNVVRVGPVRVPDSAFRFGSNETQLVFDIPEVPGLSTSGSPVEISVQNDQGRTGVYELILRPRQAIPAGRIEVGYRVPPIVPTTEPNVIANRSYILGFRATAFASQPGNYRLTPTMTVAGWTAELLEDTVDSPRSSNLFALGANSAGASADVRVRVTTPTGATGTASLVLDAVETTVGTQVNPGSNTVNFTVGSPPPTPETRLRVSLRSAQGATISGSRVIFTRSSPAAIAFNVAVTAAARYLFQARMRTPTGWTPDPITLSANQMDIAAGANQDISLIITPGSSAANTDILFTVSAPGLSPVLQFEYAQGVSVT